MTWYLRVDAEAEVPALGPDGPTEVRARLVDMLTFPRKDAQGTEHPQILQDPIWRKSAEHAEAFVEFFEVFDRVRKTKPRYAALSDETFTIAKPMLTFAGLPLAPPFMPLVSQVLRATKTKPDDYDEPEGDGEADED